MENMTIYHFLSTWRITAPEKRVSATILNADTWHAWWKGLQRVEQLPDSAAGLPVYSCTWRSHMGYQLTMVITITKHDPKDMHFSSTGDLVGTGRFEIVPSGNISIVSIYWDVRTTKTWMSRLSWLLRPIFRLNHYLLMKQGERGLESYLA